MTKDQALDWLAWGIVGGSALAIVGCMVMAAIQMPFHALALALYFAALWAIIRLLRKTDR